MNNKKHKMKGMGLSIATGVLGAGVMVSPVNVLAQEVKEELIKSQNDADAYGFGYKKSETEGVERGDSVYALRLKKGLKDTGQEFDPTKEQVKKATKVFTAGGDGEQRVQVEHDGLYEFINLQREPGFYPRLENTMHKADDEGLFEFPKKGGHLAKQVFAKEEQLLEKLELILRNPKNAGIAGDFEIIKTHKPASVYGKHFEDDELFFDLDEAKGYNRPENEKQAHRVKEWEKIDKKSESFGEFKIRSDKKIAWKVDGDKDKEVHYAERLGKDIEEGVYTIRQTASETGYLKRAEDVHFVVTLNEKAEPVLEFMDDKEFNQLHDLEYFKYGTHKDGDGVDSLYQTLLVNFPIPGVNPIDPVDPDDPNKPGGRDPNEPGYENAFDKKGLRTEERNEDLDEKKVYPEGEDVVVGDHIKVNVGEMFGLSFDMRIPENFDNYKYIDFVDPLDDRIILTDNTQVSVKLGDEDITDLVKIAQSKENGKKYISVRFTPENAEGKVEELSGENVRIEVNGIYLEGTREDIKNRAYLYYETKDEEGVPTPEDPSKHPDPKDVIDPDKPGDPLEKDPNKPNEFDPKDPTKPDRPTIPTTPEITIDPITVDFRMGVVDPGTDLLKNAEYQITDFTPSRGEGGINKENGNLYVGDVEFDINKLINDEAVKKGGFVKLANLPAGRYKMIETVAPKGKVKGDTDEAYRLVTHELVFHVNENEQEVHIEGPIVKRGSELIGDVINVEELYREEGSVKLNEENWNHDEVHEGEAMLHHYRYINTPETGTLAGIPFFLGGGVLVSAGIAINKKKKEEK